MLLTIVSFLFVFTIIAVAHELGHLYFSKRAGIRVYEFGLGFGPTIWQGNKNGTLYKLNLLPILGYVKIAGIDSDDPLEKETLDSTEIIRILDSFTNPDEPPEIPAELPLGLQQA